MEHACFNQGGTYEKSFLGCKLAIAQLLLEYSWVLEFKPQTFVGVFLAIVVELVVAID
jgi:hypothetical protein